MIFKRLFIILVSSIILLNSAYSEERVKGYTGTGNSKQAVQQAKEMCKNIGFKKESSKFNDCVIKLISGSSKNTKKIDKNQKIDNSSNLDSEYVFTGEATFGTPKKTRAQKKHEKKVANYMKMPEEVLCISYINNSGMFKKAKQAARTEAVRTRGIDCNPYMDAAFYDKERRKDGIARAYRDLATDQGDIARENEKRRANNRNRTLNCSSRKIGSSVSTSCF